MTEFYHLILNEARLQIYELKQYWFETVLSLLVMTLVFTGLFLGIKFFVVNETNADANILDQLVFGYILWAFSSGAYASASSSVAEDTQRGYIEQLFLCPAGFWKLMSARVIAGSLFLFGYMTAIIYVVMLTTGNWIKINLLELYAALLIGLPSLFGLGFVIAGLALLYRKVGTLSMIMTFALMGLVSIEGLPLNWASLLPFTPTVSLAKSLVFNGIIPGWSDIAFAALNSFVYFNLGRIVLNACESRAKNLNLIGIY